MRALSVAFTSLLAATLTVACTPASSPEPDSQQEGLQPIQQPPAHVVLRDPVPDRQWLAPPVAGPVDVPDIEFPPPPCAAPAEYEAVDLDTLLADPAEYDAEPVAVTGGVAFKTILTAMYCPPIAPNCNQCSMTAFLSGGETADVLFLHSATPVDDGVCTHSADVPLGGTIQAWGTIETSTYTVRLQLDGWCVAADSGEEE